MRYVDTSVIVAALDPLDPRRESARKFLEEVGDKVLSELVLAELVSSLVRRHLELNLAKLASGRKELDVVAILLYLMKRFKLRYARVDGHAIVPPLGELHAPIATAIRLSSDFRLKTLDMLHIAYVKLLVDRGVIIDEIITIDEELKASKEALEKRLGVTVRTL